MVLSDYNLRSMERTIPLDRPCRSFYSPELISRSTDRKLDTSLEQEDPSGREIYYINSKRKNARDIAKYLAHLSGFPKNSLRNSPNSPPFLEERYCAISRFRVPNNVPITNHIEVEMISNNYYRVKIDTSVVDPKNISKLKKRLRLN